MIRAVIIGFAHMHVNEIALYISEQPDIELVGCADVEPEIQEISSARYTRAWNMQNVSSTYGVQKFDSYTDMLDTLKPDIAFVLTENYRKVQVAYECSKRGINVSIEKPIAMTLEETLKIKEYADTYKNEIIVNWPIVWRPYIRQMKSFFETGALGRLLKVYFINGHTGPLGKGAKHRGVTEKAEEMTDEQRSKTWWYQEKCGGGAVLDIGCYGCIYSRMFTEEKPVSVYAYGANLNTPYCDAADNVAAIIKYPSSYTVAEGTWTTPQKMLSCGPVVYCENGVLYCNRNEEGDQQVFAMDVYANRIDVPEIQFPAKLKNIAWQYANHVKTGEPFDKEVTLDYNIEVMRLLDGMVRSAEEGKEIWL